MAIHEFRQALRALTRSPRLTITVVATLALAIGGAGGLFSLLDAVVLRQLPVPEPSRLVSVYPANGEAMLGIPGATLDELSRRQTVFEGICGFSRGSAQLDAGTGVVRRPAESVGGSCGALLGIRTSLGRFINVSDRADSIEAAGVSVISHSYWQSTLGSDPGIIGKTLRVQGMPLRVIGVLERDAWGMNADQRPDVILPLGLSPRLFGGSGVVAINAFGRLKYDATLEMARAELRGMWPLVWDSTNVAPAGRPPHPARSADALRIQPFGGGLSELRDRYTDSLYLLLGLAALLLALAVVNVGGLLLARAISRQQQLAIQLSLGAGYSRLTLQLSLEGLLLAIAAAAMSVPMAWWTSRALAYAMWTNALPLTMDVSPRWQTLGTIALVALAIGLVVNLPAISLLRRGPSLAQSAGTRTAFAATSIWRRSLTVCQVSMSVVLLCGAALFGRSLASIRSTDVGFRPEGLHAISIEALPGIPRQVDQAGYLGEIERRVKNIPGVTEVTFAGRFPLSAVREVTSLLPNYRNAAMPIGSEVATSTELVAPDFFAVVGTPLVQGRAFTADDGPGRPGVAMINAALAQKLFPDGDAVGRQIKGLVAAQPLTVIGVVANVTRGDPRITNAPTVFLPGLQEPGRFNSPIVVVRSSSPVDLAMSVPAAITPLGRHTVSYIRSIDEQIERHLARERMLAYLSASAASLGALIGGLGLFGLLAYAISVRTRELGVRMALGATRRRIVGMIVGEGLVLVGMGIAIGAPAAYGTARLAASLLYNIAPSDAGSLGGAAATMLAVGVVACAIPALRIARITPAEALRLD